MGRSQLELVLERNLGNFSMVAVLVLKFNLAAIELARSSS